MLYVKFVLGTAYCGTEEIIKHKYENNCTDRDIEEEFFEEVRNNAESYEYLLTGWNGENFEDLSEEEVEDELENYYNSAKENSYWEYITIEEYYDDDDDDEED